MAGVEWEPAELEFVPSFILNDDEPDPTIEPKPTKPRISPSLSSSSWKSTNDPTPFSAQATSSPQSSSSSPRHHHASILSSSPSSTSSYYALPLATSLGAPSPVSPHFLRSVEQIRLTSASGGGGGAAEFEFDRKVTLPPGLSQSVGGSPALSMSEPKAFKRIDDYEEEEDDVAVIGGAVDGAPPGLSIMNVTASSSSSSSTLSSNAVADGLNGQGQNSSSPSHSNNNNTSNTKFIWNDLDASSPSPSTTTQSLLQQPIDDASDMSDSTLSSLQAWNADETQEALTPTALLESIFPHLPSQKVLQILDECDYDIPAALEKITEMETKTETKKPSAAGVVSKSNGKKGVPLPLGNPRVVSKTEEEESSVKPGGPKQMCRHFLAGSCYRSDW
ncbi:hypothetical protein HDU97_004997 [Phlyctochytrium planicorne]|nr:hypothetical protein HDU97_004997 [Phlyctochytrium planicorne]